MQAHRMPRALIHLNAACNIHSRVKIRGTIKRKTRLSFSRQGMIRTDARCRHDQNSVPAATSTSRAAIILSASCAITERFKCPSGHSLKSTPPHPHKMRPRACECGDEIIINRIHHDSGISELQDVALSKHLEARIFSAAASKSAVSSTITVTFPAPTATAGVPVVCARCTLFWLPVQTIMSH